MVPESNRKAGPFTGTGQTQFDFDFYMLSADDVVVIVADADENETTLSKDAESNRKAGPFTGTGQTQFDFDFYMLSADDVVVIVADADENETTLSKDAYTCTLNSDQNTTPGGRVTLKTALATGHKLAICSGVPYTQNLNLTMYGNFNPTSINKEEDRRVIQIQQLAEQMRRCLTVPITNGKTPEQVLKEILEIAATANEYAQLAVHAQLRPEYDTGRARNFKDCTRYRAQARNLQRGPVYPES